VIAQYIFGTIPLETPAPTPVNEMPSGSHRTAFFMTQPESPLASISGAYFQERTIK
jgi:hypothetical protein